MFTGIIEAVGKISDIQPLGSDWRLTIDVGELDVAAAGVGASIAVDGVCLTAIEFSGASFVADVSAETLGCTTFGGYSPGTPVNLERALTLDRSLGGHLVSGHVDGVGEVIRKDRDGRSERFEFRVNGDLARYIAPKGSLAIDGISLTVNRVTDTQFEVNIVPHTLAHTTLGNREVGDRVNVEVDVVARYLERLLATAAAPEAGITRHFLSRHGFIAS